MNYRQSNIPRVVFTPLEGQAAKHWGTSGYPLKSPCKWRDIGLFAICHRTKQDFDTSKSPLKGPRKAGFFVSGAGQRWRNATGSSPGLAALGSAYALAH